MPEPCFWGLPGYAPLVAVVDVGDVGDEVYLASAQRSYGTGTCPVCHVQFVRRSGNAVCCSRTCSRDHRQQGQRERRRRRRALGPLEDALADLATQLVFDDERSFGFATAEARWLALIDCRGLQRDPGARVALRQCWLDLAAIAIRMASELEPPELEPRFDPDQRRRREAYNAAAW